MTQGVIVPEVSKPRKPIDSVATWIKAAQQKKNLNSPEFLRATIPFLLSCEVKEKVEPIVRDWQKLPITNKAIAAIFAALAEYHGEKALERCARSAENNNWTVRIYASDPKVLNGPIEEIQHKGFKVGWEAEQWACRTLYELESDSYAEIDSHTEKTKLTINRRDAMARQTPRKVECATTDQVKVSKDRLSFGVGGQYNKKFYFSRG